MKKNFFWSLVAAMIISSVSLAQDVTVNRDSVGAHGAVNQVVVVNPSPAPKVVRRMPSSVINNYYPAETCSHSCEPSIPSLPPCFPVEASSKFDYQDIWLFILTMIFAIGLGIFIGYLIWRNHGGHHVVVHSHGGRSGSYSRSSSSSHRSSSGPVPPAPAAPVTPVPAQPAPSAFPQTAEEKK